MIVRTIRGERPREDAGVRFVAKDVLEFAVCLLGATMDVPRLFASGPMLAVGIVLLVCTALAGGYAIGRLAGLPSKLAILVACGNAICGNSAIAAVAPVIDAERQERRRVDRAHRGTRRRRVLCLPLLMIPLHYNDYQYGVLAGSPCTRLPQVLAAAFAVSALSGQVATAVKLARVLMLGPVVMFFAWRGRATGDGRETVGVNRFAPWFVIGFVVLAVFRSLHVIPDGAANAAKLAAGWMTVAAMAALDFPWMFARCAPSERASLWRWPDRSSP